MSKWQERFSLEGKTAFVTGASSGIGYAIAEVFADAGADIIAQGRSEERLAELQTSIKPTGRSFTAITGDLASTRETEDMAQEALKAANGKIDILVNSAAIALTGHTEQFSVEQWDETMAVNVRAPFLLVKAIMPGMRERKNGKIINISSQTGIVSVDDHTAYASSKGALNSFTKSVMKEAAPFNVQVNAICPTVVLTKMGTELWSAPEVRDPFINRLPLGRFGEPVEIADLALYLASPASDLVNGDLILIDGGYTST